MKRLCSLLAALLALTAFAPALAEDLNAEMAELLLGDWVHEENGEYRLLFDGKDAFYYDTDGSFYYGHYAYQGNGEYCLINDEGDERVLSIYDDMSLALEGIEGYFYCGYRYWMMDFPNRDEGLWRHEDGAITLIFDLEGDFELESEDAFYYGEYQYLGGGDYLLTDVDQVEFKASRYSDGTVGLEGMDGYFSLQETAEGEDPFEFVDDLDGDTDAEDTDEPKAFLATAFDADPIPLEGTWYKYADADAMPFVLNGIDYMCENYIFGSESSGTWELSELAMMVGDEQTAAVPCLSMEAYDGMSPAWHPIPLAGNRMLYSNSWDVWFLHESMIGTEDGATLRQLGEFLRTGWWCTDGTSTSLKFSCMDNVIIFASYNAEGEGGQEIVGRWRLMENAVIADYDDGTSASYPLTAGAIRAGELEFSKD